MKNLQNIVESVLTRRWSKLTTVWNNAAEHPDTPNESLNILDVWVALDKMVAKKKAKTRPIRSRGDNKMWKKI